MRSLQIDRVGSREEFQFTLRGIIDAEGARAIDRLLLNCQGKGAQRVRLDLHAVESVSSLGIVVLTRWGRAYEETDRRIELAGLSPEIRLALQHVGAIIYLPNAPPAAVSREGTVAGSAGIDAARAPHVTTPTLAQPPHAGTPTLAQPDALVLEPPAPKPDEPLERRPDEGFAARPAEPLAAHSVESFAAHPAEPLIPASPYVEPAPTPLRSASSDPSPMGHEPSPVGPELSSIQSKLKRKIVEFRNLFEITRAMNLARDLDEVMNLLGLSVMGQFGLERLALFLSDPEKRGHLVPRQVRGFGQEHFQDFVIPWTAFRKFGPDRSFLSMSEIDGKSTGSDELEALRESGFEWAVLLWVRRDLEGVLFLGGRGTRKSFEEDESDLLTILAHQGAVAISNARVQRATEERNLGLVRGMMALIESRDGYAKGSTERVVRYVSAVARLLDYPKEHLKSLVYGAVLRDIGMITVSGLILKNPAHLSEEEWSLIKQHPVRGAQILEEMNFPKEVIAIVLNHHERWGGEGYPNGIRGEDIPLGARIVSLVDAYVAMTCERPYRRALPYEKSRQVIAENWGCPFDPSVVEVFLSVLDKIERRTRLRSGQPLTGGPEEQAGGAVGPPASLDPLSSGATIPAEGRP